MTIYFKIIGAFLTLLIYPPQAAAEKMQIREIQTAQICYDMKWKKCLKFERQAQKAQLEFEGPFDDKAQRKISANEMQKALEQLIPLIADPETNQKDTPCLAENSVDLKTETQKVHIVHCPRNAKSLHNFYLWTARYLAIAKAQP